MPTHLVRAHPDRRPSFPAPEPTLAPPTEAYEGDIVAPPEEIESEPGPEALPTPSEASVRGLEDSSAVPLPCTAPPPPSMTEPGAGPGNPTEEPVASSPHLPPQEPAEAAPALPDIPSAPGAAASEEPPLPESAASLPPLPANGGGSDWRVPSAHELRSAYGRLHHRTVRSRDQAALWAEGTPPAPGRRGRSHR
jgi:hypothetical protein